MIKQAQNAFHNDLETIVKEGGNKSIHYLLAQAVRYVNTNLNSKIGYDGKQQEGFIAYADADWASDHISRKSVTGYITFENVLKRRKSYFIMSRLRNK